MRRSLRLSWSGIAAVLAACAAFGAAPPNLILVMTDDQGYGEVGRHGNPILRTPHLDQLHDESVRFTDFHVSPTCAPTRAALLTGRHEFRSGVTHTIAERERLSLSAVTWPQLLQSAGYRTGIFGKWHLGDEPAYQPERRGFDEVFIHGGGGIGQTFPGSCGDAPGNTYHDPWVRENGRFVRTAGYCTDVFFARALRWVDEQRRASHPFFALITPNAPHDPFISPGPEFEAAYLGRGLSTNAVAYYAMIANIDANVGKLLAQLRQWDLDAKTIVLFLTDNGHSVGDLYNAGMRGLKGGPYQGGTRVPSFWRWPGHWQPGDRPQLAAHIDVLPTVAELAGVTLPPSVRAQLEGRSLVPLLRSREAPWPDRFLFTHVGRWNRGKAAEAQYRQCAVRNARFRLVNHAELYDLRSDPGETRDVAGQYPDVVTALRAAYDRWWRETLPGLVNETVVGPPVNPFKAQFWAAQGGGPDAALQAAMDPFSEPSQRRFSGLLPQRPASPD